MGLRRYGAADVRCQPSTPPGSCSGASSHLAGALPISSPVSRCPRRLQAIRWSLVMRVHHCHVEEGGGGGFAQRPG